MLRLLKVITFKYSSDLFSVFMKFSLFQMSLTKSEGSSGKVECLSVVVHKDEKGYGMTVSGQYSRFVFSSCPDFLSVDLTWICIRWGQIYESHFFTNFRQRSGPGAVCRQKRCSMESRSPLRRQVVACQRHIGGNGRSSRRRRYDKMCDCFHFFLIYK